MLTLLVASLRLSEASWSASNPSLGDRLVLEHKYLSSYENLPTDVNEAEAAGWSVSSTCTVPSFYHLFIFNPC
jgi:hypothetical protein